MEIRTFLDPVKLMGGNFGVDGTRSAEKLGALVKVALEKEFPEATVVVTLGPEAVVVVPNDPDLALRALNIVGAMRKTSDYLVFV